MPPTKSTDPTRKRTDHYPQWLDNLPRTLPSKPQP